MGPYCYPHVHKNEMERQVHDMLQQGIIKESAEPDVLNSREVFEAGQQGRPWLVQWKGRTMEDATWKDEFVLRIQFLDFNGLNKTRINCWIQAQRN